MAMRWARLAAVLTLAIMVKVGPRAGATESPERMAEVESYLNSIETMKARFTQVAPDGRYSTGELYLHRPSRMRLDYDPPSKVLVVATDWRLVFWDGATEQQTVIPVSQTPVKLLLDEQISLSGEISVVDWYEQAGELVLTVITTENPAQGRLQLVLGQQPFELRRWAVTDAQGLTTHVILEDVETGVALDRSLFRWRNPRFFGPPDED
ncbi:MAG: outer membrane lipoprotein carrier protein LolA [Geminicoccaceae bacterium]